MPQLELAHVSGSAGYDVEVGVRCCAGQARLRRARKNVQARQVPVQMVHHVERLKAELQRLVLAAGRAELLVDFGVESIASEVPVLSGIDSLLHLDLNVAAARDFERGLLHPDLVYAGRNGGDGMSPESVDRVFRIALAAVLVRYTFAPGRAGPVESLIRPVTSPNVWATSDIAEGAVTVLTTKKERLTLTNSLLELGRA
jgi:hypothetical protein